MIKEIKEDWIKALRSGDYEQGEEYLRSGENHFCCLGVLCDLFLNEKTGRDWGNLENGEEVLPIEIMDWAGLQSQNPRLKYKDGTIQEVSNFNDGTSTDMKGREIGQLDFNEIANLIEAQL